MRAERIKTSKMASEKNDKDIVYQRKQTDLSPICILMVVQEAREVAAMLALWRCWRCTKRVLDSRSASCIWGGIKATA